MDKEPAIRATRSWVDSVVLQLDLCPFAARELTQGRVRFTATHAHTEQQLLQALSRELEFLRNTPSIETTLLIHPAVLQRFPDYNQFLNAADGLLRELQLGGVFQIASFHPHYQFAGTIAGDAENFTNRSPYPMLHLLREASLERAISAHPDTSEIPTRNIDRMRALGAEKLVAMLAACTRQD